MAQWIEIHSGPDGAGRYSYTVHWSANYHPGDPKGEHRTAERGQRFFAPLPAWPCEDCGHEFSRHLTPGTECVAVEYEYDPPHAIPHYCSCTQFVTTKTAPAHTDRGDCHCAHDPSDHWRRPRSCPEEREGCVVAHSTIACRACEA